MTQDETPGEVLDRLGMDGVKWATEFRKTALQLGYSDMDEGWLIGWFCNAIMAGYDRATAPNSPASAPVRVKPDRETFDAMCAMRDSINEHIPMPSLESDLLQGPENSVFCAAVAEAVVSEVTRLRSIINKSEGMAVAKIKPLVWHNFDAWTHWAEGACGTYHVEERNGYWQVELRVGGLVHGVTETDDTTPADLDTAKAAAQADYEARIRAALEPDAGVVAELVEALRLADAALSGANMNMKVVERKLKAALALIAHNTTEG